ncbi:DUF3307 domain-containing protein [Bacillus sp. 16GRE42]|uniref:DUF3307 domain-containing protein n=1 Tax=Bacillus sp. 16GRE42 TaxID=2778092 RepID=UPI001C9A5105|nr:DUF3307 domain-containing protein [Bacillus sp. 16GRE42]MBY7125966.1 DUF3307 domain-containing protein [Bacillus sp. 16GRE42]
MSELVFSLIFGHFLADYLFQTDKINKGKESSNKKEKHKALFIHVVIHFITYVLIAVFIGQFSFVVFGAILLICIFHFFTDIGKEEFKKYPNVNSSTWSSVFIYILDQILHIIFIIFSLRILSLITYDWNDILKFLGSFLFSGSSGSVNFSTIDKITAVGSVIMFNTYFCAYLFEIILKPFKPNADNFIDSTIEHKLNLTYKDNKLSEEYVIEKTNIQNHYQEPPTRVGKYIGMIERLVIMFLIGAQAFVAITFIVTIKALTRFKQFDDKCFAEYYLIGSLLSVLFAIISGYLLILIVK